MSRFWEVREDPEYYDEDPEIIPPEEWEDAFPDSKFDNWVEVMDAVAERAFESYSPFDTVNS